VATTSAPTVPGTILRAGLTCGVMDITAAFVVYGGFFGIPPVRLLQGIAAGLMGARAALAGGFATAALGLCCHFTVAMGAATVYVLASRWIRALVEHAVAAGVLYGILWYFFMQKVVVPLSAIRPSPFNLKLMLVGIVIHIFCVGLPISLTTASRRKHEARVTSM